MRRRPDGLDDACIVGTIKYRRVSSPQEFQQHLALTGALVQSPNPTVAVRSNACRPGCGEAPQLDLLFFQRLSAKPAA
jgi:hypothetical protein